MKRSRRWERMDIQGGSHRNYGRFRRPAAARRVETTIRSVARLLIYTHLYPPNRSRVGQAGTCRTFDPLYCEEKHAELAWLLPEGRGVTKSRREPNVPVFGIETD